MIAVALLVGFVVTCGLGWVVNRGPVVEAGILLLDHAQTPISFKYKGLRHIVMSLYVPMNTL
jgi:hypothetical protein